MGSSKKKHSASRAELKRRHAQSAQAEPVAKGVPPDEQGEEDPRGSAVLSTGGELVLVVDEERAIRMLVKQVLENHGYRALVAKNGVEALEVLRAHREELRVILLDLGISSEARLQIFTGIRTLCARARVILSGDGQALDGEDLASFLSKPYSTRELLAAVGHALNNEAR